MHATTMCQGVHYTFLSLNILVMSIMDRFKKRNISMKRLNLWLLLKHEQFQVRSVVVLETFP